MAVHTTIAASAVIAIASAQKCIEPGWRTPSFVRRTPGAETIDYTSTCQPWSDMTCCTAEYTRALAQGIDKVYNNFSYNYCGTMGPRCRQFLEWEECFYACDPYAAYYEDSGINTGSFRNLPLCGNFCDDWFDACADELTCATDWVTDFAQDPVTFAWTGCKDPTCTRFRDRFANGTDMCTRMWNTNFVVSRDPKKCFSPWFYSTNPNNFAAGIVPTTAAPSVVTTELIAASVVAAVGWFCLFTAFCVQCARGDSRMGNFIRNKLNN